MMEVVTGGSGSGKSAYAEQKICGLQQGTGRLYYIATMYPYGSETERKIVPRQTGPGSDLPVRKSG